MKVVIIGGSSGLGFATAQLAVAQGAQVVIGGRNQENLDAAQKELGSVETMTVDVQEEISIKRFFEKVGPFDHLVTPGNHTSPGTFEDLTAARASFDSKYWGQYLAVRYGHPFLREGGSIVLFSGILGTKPAKNCGIMASVNGAIEALTRALAVDLAPKIRVNAVAPGSIESPRLLELAKKNPKAGFEQTQTLLVPRLGHPQEVAETVLFLISNGYLSGSVLHVDGGYLLS